MTLSDAEIATAFQNGKSPEHGSVPLVSETRVFRVVGASAKILAQERQHILFEEDIVLMHCTTRSKFKSVLFIWRGNRCTDSDEEVNNAIQQVADLSAQKIEIKQGEESARFLRNIGGILLVRKGSRNIESSGEFLLMVRRIEGGTVLDEIDFHVSNLCSGYAFLMRSMGKVYIWQGRGCWNDEVGIATLVANDIYGTDPIIHVGEGEEPPEFFDILGDPTINSYASASFWKQKPHCEDYRVRFFRLQADVTEKIRELHYLSQSSLVATGIYVLDAYFELYVIVGSHCQSKRLDFLLALQFATQYAQIAVKSCRPSKGLNATVVLPTGGVPRDLRVLFRKWSEEYKQEVLGRTSSLRVLDVDEARQLLK